jgi:hypothetical protein
MSEDKVPEEFVKVIKDFVTDLKITFPEYNPLINKWWKEVEDFSYIEEEEERKITIEKTEKQSLELLFHFCQKRLPPRFFDILYQNEDIFKDDSEIDTEFLPHIHFKNLWQFDISQKTRDTIWKYLQLILFSIVGTLDNKDAFGDTAKMFEAINQEEFKTKLEETLSKMQELFADIPSETDPDSSEEKSDGLGGNFNMEDMPKANDIHEHITGMLDGKLGKLAREIAEETAADINMDMENVTDMKDILNNLIKNPTKLMGLVKNVGDKLDTRIKSGELKESELISEASDLINKMKNMKGMGDIQSMLNKMGMGGMMGGLGNLSGLGGKVNTGAMEAELNKNIKIAQTKERIKSKAEANKLAKEKEKLNIPQDAKPAISEEEIIKIFSTGENVERTPRQNANKKSKKGKGKK